MEGGLFPLRNSAGYTLNNIAECIIIHRNKARHNFSSYSYIYFSIKLFKLLIRQKIFTHCPLTLSWSFMFFYMVYLNHLITSES